jgi:hypothetical protein
MKTLLTSTCAGLHCLFLAGSLALAQAPAITLTPDQVYKEYQTDPMFLDKYKGKTIRVTGVVSQALANNPGSIVVWLKTSASSGPAPNQVRCLASDAQKALVSALRPDVPARITGTFAGFSMAFGGILNPCRVEAAAPRPEAPLADLTVTPDQMVKEFQTDPVFLEKYKGKTIHVTGVVSRSSAGGQNIVWVKSSVSTPASSGNMVRCIVPEAQKMSLAPLRPDTPVKMTGRFTGFSMTFGGILDPCSVEVTKAAPMQPATATGPADPPFGDYAVYQLVWPSFSYQYRFALTDRSHYNVIGKTPGTYTYDSRTKILTFQSGGLEGFIGLYYTQGRNANGPTICLSHDGRAPNLQGPNTQGYQYAYFRPQGMK